MNDSNSISAGTPALFGLETEYAYAAQMNYGVEGMQRLEHEQLFLGTAQSLLPHLPGTRRDLFLANGSRLYVDCGGHPELATPECTNPWQAVRYALAGDQIVGQVVAQLDAGQPPLLKRWLSKCNVDYSGLKTTWGCHHSFLYRCQQVDLFKQLTPHLVSRIVYSGAGGWNPFSDGLQFTLSPRTLHLDAVLSRDGLMSRGILNTRDESLSSDGNKRLHLQCGDSLESQTAIFLTMGTTALVVALTHAGIATGSEIELADPLAAMRAFAVDPTCHATAPTIRGDQVSAVAIQRHHLQLAEKHAGQAFMPRWTPWVCRLWREILDRLEEGAPHSVAGTLDWAIKYAMFERVLRRAGADWQNVAATESGLRERLFEADMRFAQVSGTGLFRQLDEAGVLRHRVPGVGDISRAVGVPPAGRARVRGRLIRELNSTTEDVRADWAWVANLQTNQMVNLSDPFCRKVDWQESPHDSVPGKLRYSTADNEIDRVAICYRQGRYQEAADRLERFRPAVENGAPDYLKIRYWRYRAWVATRQGSVDGFELLSGAPAREQTLDYLYDHLSVARFQGLAVPLAATQVWIDRSEELIRASGLHRYQELAYLEHKAAYFLRCGRLAEAAATLEEGTSGGGGHAHIRGRHAALLGETYRRLDRPDKARTWLARAWRIQRREGITGDLADYTFCILAKLEKDLLRSCMWLKRAEDIQAPLDNRVGLTRAMLLMARLLETQPDIEKLREEIYRVSTGLTALITCEVFQRIWRDWDTWTRDKQATDEHGDRFWGL